MITYLLISILLNIVMFIASPLLLLPDVSIPAAIASGIASAGIMLAIFYQIVPFTLTALGVIIGVMFVFEASVWTYKLIKWVYQKIPGIN